jgi:hypothetical protein
MRNNGQLSELAWPRLCDVEVAGNQTGCGMPTKETINGRQNHPKLTTTLATICTFQNTTPTPSNLIPNTFN